MKLNYIKRSNDFFFRTKNGTHFIETWLLLIYLNNTCSILTDIRQTNTYVYWHICSTFLTYIIFYSQNGNGVLAVN